MDFEALEKQIVDYLSANVDSNIATINVLPDALSDYKKPYETAIVWVMFFGEKVDDPQSTNETSQHTTLTFSISIQSRLLRGTTGIYAVSEMIKLLLVGKQFTDCGRMYYVSHDFAKAELDVWEHTLSFAARSLRVQNFVESDFPYDGDQPIYASKVDVDNGSDEQTIYYNSNN